jgi:hypothetical protein
MVCVPHPEGPDDDVGSAWSDWLGSHDGAAVLTDPQLPSSKEWLGRGPRHVGGNGEAVQALFSHRCLFHCDRRAYYGWSRGGRGAVKRFREGSVETEGLFADLDTLAAD